jgi:hypothetical protein
MNDAVSALTLPKTRTLADRVRDIGRALGCDAIWVRASGPHVLVGLGADEGFARVTPLGSGAFGLSFRSPDPVDQPRTQPWEDMFLVDALAEIVEHALIGAGALPTPG